MTFERYNKDEGQCEPLNDEDSGTIKFGNNGIIVHLDCGKSDALTKYTLSDGTGVHCLTGTSATLVPPNLVRYIRTKVWPTDKNKEIDARDQDTPCSLEHPKVPFYVPYGEFMQVTYKFSNGCGGVVKVVGPSTNFFSQINPRDFSRSKDQEGVIFIGHPDVLRGEAIFGLVRLASHAQLF